MDNMELKFNNPTFRRGWNLTVRRGTKWDGVRSVLINGQQHEARTSVIMFFPN